MRATTKVFLQHIKSFPYYIYGLFVTIFHLIHPIDSSLDYETSSTDVEQFIEHFERKYGKIRPSFANSSYITCVNRAKLTLNYLLIYLHGDDHEDSDCFCRKTLCDSEFVEFIRQLSSEGLVEFWACNINSSEGFGLSKIIREHSYPFIGLVAVNPNGRMYLVARSEGNLTVGELMKFIRCSMDDNSVGLAICRADREERCNNRLCKQELDVGYANFLHRAHESNRVEPVCHENLLLKKQKQSKLVEEQTQLLSQWRIKQKRVSSLLPCPLTDSDETPHVILRIKFPCGSIVQSSFYLTDSIKLIYYTVFCSEKCPRDFKVYQNFPKLEVACKPSQLEWDDTIIIRTPRADFCDPPDFVEANLTSNTMLYVVDYNL